MAISISTVPKNCISGSGGWVVVSVSNDEAPVHINQVRLPDPKTFDPDWGNAKIVEIILDENHPAPQGTHTCTNTVKWVCPGETDDEESMIYHAYDGIGGGRTLRGKSVVFTANDSTGEGIDFKTDNDEPTS